MENDEKCVILSKKEYDGRYYKGHPNSECLLFPSKDKRNWDDV